MAKTFDQLSTDYISNKGLIRALEIDNEKIKKDLSRAHNNNELLRTDLEIGNESSVLVVRLKEALGEAESLIGRLMQQLEESKTMQTNLMDQLSLKSEELSTVSDAWETATNVILSQKNELEHRLKETELKVKEVEQFHNSSTLSLQFNLAKNNSMLIDMYKLCFIISTLSSNVSDMNGIVKAIVSSKNVMSLLSSVTSSEDITLAYPNIDYLKHTPLIDQGFVIFEALSISGVLRVWSDIQLKDRIINQVEWPQLEAVYGQCKVLVRIIIQIYALHMSLLSIVRINDIESLSGSTSFSLVSNKGLKFMHSISELVQSFKFI